MSLHFRAVETLGVVSLPAAEGSGQEVHDAELEHDNENTIPMEKDEKALLNWKKEKDRASILILIS